MAYALLLLDRTLPERLSKLRGKKVGIITKPTRPARLRDNCPCRLSSRGDRLAHGDIHSDAYVPRRRNRHAMQRGYQCPIVRVVEFYSAQVVTPRPSLATNPWAAAECVHLQPRVIGERRDSATDLIKVSRFREGVLLERRVRLEVGFVIGLVDSELIE